MINKEPALIKKKKIYIFNLNLNSQITIFYIGNLTKTNGVDMTLYEHK